MEPEVPIALRLPMEDPEAYPAFWPRLGHTLALAFKQPLGFFERVPNGEGFLSPLGFALLLSVPIYLFLCLYPCMFLLMGLMTRFGGQSGPVPPFHWMALGCSGGIIVLPLLQLLAMFLSGVVHYLTLRVWGVHDPAIPFKQDLRSWFYAYGFLGVAAWTPLGPIAMLGVMVVSGMGSARMHRVPIWKGAAAALTHVGGVLVLVFGIVFATLFLGARAAQRNPRPVFSQGVNSLQVLPDMAPETVVDRHLDQARVTLNELAGQGCMPEKAVEQALKALSSRYQPSVNPYNPGVTAFCAGSPGAMGQVGLTPLHNFSDATSGYKFEAGVSVEAWSKEGRTRRYVMFGRR